MKNIITLFSFYATLALGCYGQNQPPTGMADTMDIIEQVPILLEVKSNDYDPEGDQFYIFDIGLYNPSSAVIDIIDDKIWIRSNPEKYYVRIWYQLYDGNNLSAKINVVLNVLSNPNLPVAVADTVDLMQLIPQQVNLLSNDYDPNGDEFKIHSVVPTYTCSVAINEDSLSVSVTPNLTSNEYSFWYNIKEKNTENLFISNQVMVKGNLLSNPDMPVIAADVATATGGIESVIDVLSNDHDNQGDPIEVAGFTQPTNGTLTLNNNKFYYTPFLSYAGSDVFTYVIREIADTNIYSNIAFVNITVAKNPNCPVGVADYASTMTGTEVIIDVISNDYDPNGDPFIIKDVEGGTIIMTPEMKIKYKSSFLTLGADTIRYRISETGNTDSYSEWIPVYITLTTNPDLPVAMPDTIWTQAGIPVSIRPLLNDIKNNADTLIMSVSLDDAPQTGHWGKISVVKDTFNYQPIYQANGIDRFRYRVRDANAYLAMGDIVVICESKFYDSLLISNINAGVNGGSFLFSRYAELPGSGLFFNSTPPGWTDIFTSHFEYPKFSRKNTIFNSTIWAGGLDSENNLHMAAERYKQGPGANSGIDFQPGPIATNYDTGYLKRYIRTWKVSRAQVEDHMNNYWKSEYTPPEAILNWPGNGNVSNGEAAVLAPFFDKNADGNYDCTDGDYPLIRGDETIFLMFNDDLAHTESLGTPVGMEVHAMVYGFQNPADTAIYNSVFVHYDLINRSENTYHDFYFGVFTDTELGYAQDDYIGCDVAHGSFYTYNGRPQDGNGEYWAYGDNLPAQSVTILAGPFKDNDNLDNLAEDCSESINGLNYGNGIQDDERLGMRSFMYFNNYGSPGPYMLDPKYATDYYNILQAKWLDGSEMMYGGNGHPSTGAVGPACKYMYPGDSDPTNWGTNCLQPNGGYNQNGKYWTDAETQNMYGDRRGFASMGPITFHPGQIQEIELAFCIGQASEGLPGSGLENLFTNLDNIKEQVTNGNIIAPNNELGIKQMPSTNNSILIYPNPAGEFLNIDNPTQDESAYFTIYNIIGNEVSEGMITNHKRQTLNISFLKPGIYLFRVYNQKNNYVVKFIKK